MQTRRLVSAVLLASALSAPVAAQDLVANYRFNDNFTSSDPDPLSAADPLSPSAYTIFYSGSLCLMSQWTSGGSLVFTVTPQPGVANDYTDFEFAIAGNTGGPVTVDSVTLKINGTPVGNPRPIDAYPANDVFQWSLSFSSEQPTTFEIDFGGRSGGSAACELTHCNVHCYRRPKLHPVGAIAECSSACFDVSGCNFNNITAIEIDGTPIGQTGWTNTINSWSSMTVCPPTGIAAGTYELRVFGGGQSSDSEPLVVTPSVPTISQIANPSLPSVTNDCFELQGCGFAGVTSVQFGGQTITSQDSADFGQGYFTIVDNHNLEICPPLCLAAGPYHVTVTNSVGTSGSAPVALVEPTSFTLACAANHPIGSPQTIYLHSGGSTGFMFPILSGELLPTVIPGIVNLGIGNQATSYLVAGSIMGPCGSASIGSIFPKLLGTTLFFQGILWDFNNPTLPLPVSNICATNYVTSSQAIDIAPLRNGVVAQDNATGTGYLMYSAQGVPGRFSSNWIWSEVAEHFVVVVQNGSAWEYDNNSVYTPFTPAATDLLVAELDFTADTATLLTGVQAPINGIAAGFFASDLVMTPNFWNGSANNGEFELAGTFLQR